MGIAESIIGPADGRTRWLHPSYDSTILPAPTLSSCPGLSRASTSLPDVSKKDLDGRVKPYDIHTSPTALLFLIPFSESMMLRRHSEAEMEGSLGRFGDRRLEKGGPASWQVASIDLTAGQSVSDVSEQVSAMSPG